MLTGGLLEVNGTRIALDDAGAETCFVSHAHADHTEAFSKGKRIIASEETFALMGKEPHGIRLPRLSLHHAGHMLGARQLRAECDGGVFAYTGDFSLQDSYTSKAAEFLRCDTLMIDSTYCQPHMRLPARFEVLSSMEKWVKRNSDSVLVFGAYNSGKAQELVSFLNRECGIAPVVGERAAKICARYEKCGLRLDYLAAGTEEANEAMRSRFISLMPPSSVSSAFGASLSNSLGRKVKTAVATGWAAVCRFAVDEAFPLSDHADFSETLHYIKQSGAKEVVCANSGAEAAAAALRRQGISAATKEEHSKGVQQVLA